MKQIKNNFKFSNNKNYNKEFLCELENKEEFGCLLNACGGNNVPCSVNLCAVRN